MIDCRCEECFRGDPWRVSFASFWNSQWNEAVEGAQALLSSQCSPDSVVACAKWCLMRWHKARSEGQCQEAAQAGLNQNSCSFSASVFPHLLPESGECVPLACCENMAMIYCLPAQPCVKLGNCPTYRTTDPKPPHRLLWDQSSIPWSPEQGSVLEGSMGWMCSVWDMWPEGQGAVPGLVEICRGDR